MDDAVIAQLRAAESLLPEDDGLMAVDPDLRVVFWSSQMEAIFGLRSEELLRRALVEALPFMTRNGGEDRLRAALGGRRVKSGEQAFTVPTTRRQGTYEARSAPLRDGTGAIVGVSTVVRDVTERRGLEEQLRETESRFRNMADASPVLLWMSGTDSLCTFFNHTWLRFTGRTLAQEYGVGWAEGVHFEDFSRCMDVYERAFSAREDFEMEYRLRRADGEYRWVLDRGTPRFTDDGTFAGFIGSCVDISDHRSVEAKLRQSIRDREDFLSIASHELRTPLTSLVLGLERLARDATGATGANPDTERFVRDAKRAVHQAHRLDELVDDLLDITTLVSGRFELSLAQADLAAIACTAVDRMSEPARRAGTPLILEAGSPVIGTWDRSRLERVVTNLLSNAVKYGRGKPVRVAVTAEADSAVLTVCDEGIGIDPSDQRRIFGRFERAVSARNYSGFGLGLWIVQELVRAHGGEVGMESSPGSGTTLKVSLPREAKTFAQP
jgi:PAS domain S-box-containing protein